MLWALFWIQIALVVLGFFLLWQGLRGRYSDEHPHCRKCGYDLYGLVSGTKLCPECGAELRRRGAIQIGIPRRRWGLVVIALLCGALGYGVTPVRRVVVRRWVMRPLNFLSAIKAGDDRAVEELLSADPRLIRLRPAEQSLLDLAVSSSRPEKVMMRLLAAGADSNEVGSGDGFRPLHRAAWEDKPGAAQVLLSGGADANAKDAAGETPLHFAARGPAPGTIPRMLLAEGADPNARDGRGQTPLHSAAAGKDPAVLRVLLAGGANINAANDEGRTPLHVAMAARNWDVTLALVREGADLAAKDKAGKLPAQLARETGGAGGAQFVALVYYGALSHRSKSDRLEDVRQALKADPAALKEAGPDGPLLHVAVALRQTALAKVLLECGADPNLRDAGGKTPLHRASWGHDPPTVSLLLSQKADVNARDDEGRTPLHAAADSPAGARTAEILLDGGADAGAKDKQGIKPLECAATSAADIRDEFIEAMLKHGVEIDVYAAAALGRVDDVRRILDKDPKLVEGGPGTHRATPLHVAAWHGQLEAARLLLDRGADVNAGADGKDPPGRTPLFDAIGKRRLDVAGLLLKRGARTDVRNVSGATPLHVATLSGIGEPGVRLLLEHKADPNAQDPAGQTPLHLAAGYCAVGTVQALLDAGADPSLKDKSGLAAVDHARRINLSRPEVVEVLQRAAEARRAAHAR